MGFLAFEEKEEDGVTMEMCNPVLRGEVMDGTLDVVMATCTWMSAE